MNEPFADDTADLISTGADLRVGRLRPVRRLLGRLLLPLIWHQRRVDEGLMAAIDHLAGRIEGVGASIDEMRQDLDRIVARSEGEIVAVDQLGAEVEQLVARLDQELAILEARITNQPPR